MVAVTTAAVTTTRFRWDRLTYASALGYCLLVAALSVGAVLGELREQFDLSGVLAALHGSTFGIGLLVMGMWGVPLVDRIGRRTALAAASAAIAGGVTLFCVGQAWPLTLLGTLFSGTGAALLVMVMPGLISDHHGEHRAEAFAAVNGAPGIAGVLYSLAVGAAIAAGWSWRGPYLGITAGFVVALALVAWPVEVPDTVRDGRFSLRPMRERDVLVPWLKIVNAVLAEFTVSIWAVAYLHEVGGAGSGIAPVLAAVFGVMMFTSRLAVPWLLRVFGERTIPAGFVTIGVGATVMCLAPGVPAKVLGLALVGFGGGPLYPLTIDGLYRSAGQRLDSVSLGAVGALASGTAVTIGPLALGVLADQVGLRWALLVVPCLAALGAVTQWPRRHVIVR